MYYVYLLKCADTTLHVGSTFDLKAAVAQHEAGNGARYTARRLPVQLVYVEHHLAPRDALVRERDTFRATFFPLLSLRPSDDIWWRCRRFRDCR